MQFPSGADELIRLVGMGLDGMNLWNVVAASRGPDLQTKEDQQWKADFTEPIRGYFFPFLAKGGGAYFVNDQDDMHNLKFWQGKLNEAERIRTHLHADGNVTASTSFTTISAAKIHYLDHIRYVLKLIVRLEEDGKHEEAQGG